MSRVSDKNKDSILPEPEDVDSEISDDDEGTEEGDREETPDLYRNSSLGMYVKRLFHVIIDFTDIRFNVQVRRCKSLMYAR